MRSLNTYRIGQFRRGALVLLLLGLPFLSRWLFEGQLGADPHIDPEAQAAALLAAHRIAGWLLPVTLGSVFAFGIAQTEPDPRFVTMGRYDPRRVWLHRWLPVGGMFLLVSIASAGLLSWWSTESLIRLVSATATATLFALAVGFLVSMLTGAVPGVVALVTAIIVVGVMLLPSLLGLPIAMSLSPGPLGWLRGEGLHTAFLVHAAVVLGLALALFWIALTVPRDIRRVRWIANFRGHDA
jgi:hypothetical protein